MENHDAHMETRFLAAQPQQPKSLNRRAGEGVVIKVGAIRYKSITAFARSCAKKSGLGYMTVYMRLRAGMSPQEAMAKPARAYRKAGKQLELQF